MSNDCTQQPTNRQMAVQAIGRRVWTLNEHDFKVFQASAFWDGYETWIKAGTQPEWLQPAPAIAPSEQHCESDRQANGDANGAHLSLPGSRLPNSQTPQSPKLPLQQHLTVLTTAPSTSEQSADAMQLAAPLTPQAAGCLQSSSSDLTVEASRRSKRKRSPTKMQDFHMCSALAAAGPPATKRPRRAA
jgi:hypothetical protein